MPRDAESPGKYHVPALESALDTLEVLAASAKPCSISDLSAAVDKRPGSLFRIMTTLERRGYVHKDPETGHYALTLRFLHLAHLTAPMRRLVPVAAPFMRALADDLNESCHLSVLEESEMVVVHEVPCARPIRLIIDIGARHHVLDTLSGRVMMAGMPAGVLDAFIERDEALRALSGSDHREFCAQLDQIRADGYATRNSGLHRGVDDFSAPIGPLPDGPIAALTVTTLERVGHQHEVQAIVDHLLDTAGQINTALGAVMEQQLPAEEER